jgi:hypothetical protein
MSLGWFRCSGVRRHDWDVEAYRNLGNTLAQTMVDHHRVALRLDARTAPSVLRVPQRSGRNRERGRGFGLIRGSPEFESWPNDVRRAGERLSLRVAGKGLLA